MDPLIALRLSIASKNEASLVRGSTEYGEVDDIVQATGLKFPPLPGVSSEETVLPLDTITRFEIQEESGPKRIDLKTVYNCWITKDLSVTDYITISDERGILNLKFLERADLITWLEGASTESEYVKDYANDTTEKPTGEKQAEEPDLSVKPTHHEVDPLLQQIYDQERVLMDHNKNLRGTKITDFSSVSLECRQNIIGPYRNGLKQIAQGKSRSAGVNKATPSTSSSKNKEPIIIISPSASSLLNMANIKEFLEEGVFKPTVASSGVANIQRISRSGPKIGSIKVLVVNSVEKFKPEYWERVVAVFATGQAWQFAPYQWSDPKVLFQKVAGFALVYKGDPVPSTLKQWNLRVEEVDRNSRFRDREVAQRIWDRIDQSIIQKGFTKR